MKNVAVPAVAFLFPPATALACGPGQNLGGVFTAIFLGLAGVAIALPVAAGILTFTILRALVR